MLGLLLWGSRASLLVGFSATAMAMIIGTTLGMAAGHFTGIVRAVVLRIIDFFLVVPSLVLAIVLSAVLSRGLSTIIIAIGVTCWAHTARVVRAQTLTIETRPYIERSRALGAGDRHIIGKHVFPSVLPLVMANTTLMVGHGDHPRVDAGLPRPRRSHDVLVGLDAQDRARHRRRDGRLLVVRPRARHRDRHRRAVLHPRGSRARGRSSTRP